ncbi:outer membrane beta-barrel protein [Halopseudomonas pelagia]|uniref:outer membrane beta-barrel protein n=1 Tax=Halopseudomonas pelagia TaxID=553151 RepID=UPI000399B88D|nr:outer membrane beta-barrel protein [Halopseudomonas pelagia]|tara:strand:+ start:59562 stop:60716 length:1155 start_codon:yes stop_codon:yes gene_type:complete
MRNSTCTFIIIAGCLSADALAVEPQSIDLAGFDFTPQLLLGERYDDNLRGDSENELSSWVTTIQPSFQLTAEGRKTGHQLKYLASREIYHSDSDASHTDHHLTLKSVLELTSRHRLSAGLGHHRIEETTDTTLDDVNDKYTLTNAELGYTFGAATARNQIDLLSRYEQRRFQNSNGINDDQERDSLGLTSTWYHRLSPRTRTLGELRYTDHDYTTDLNNRSSTNTAALIGGTWEATAKTTGTLRVGVEQKNFDDSNRTDYTSPMWDLGLTWSPRTYSTFGITARRAFDEGDDGASTVQDINTLLSWDHTWSPWISTELEYQILDREYKATERQDDRTAFGAAVVYSYDRWADFKLGYRRVDNDSNISDNDYQRNLYLLIVELSL